MSWQELAAFLPTGWSTQWVGWVSVLAQLSILAALVFVVYQKLVYKTQAEQLVKGVFFLLLAFGASWWLASLFGFELLQNALGLGIQLLMIGLIVIFQPELRRVLSYIGQQELFGKSVLSLGESPPEEKTEHVIQELLESIRFLSKSKIGTLLVLESSHAPDSPYLEAGTPLDAKLSTELLLTIFQPKTPLHDGAVVIDSDKRVAAAGVLLPLTENPKLSWQYGTRHRAAIGLTETSDNVCIVVSEETGSISFVQNGTIEKITRPEDLRKKLEKFYQVSLVASLEKPKQFWDNLRKLGRADEFKTLLPKVTSINPSSQAAVRREE